MCLQINQRGNKKVKAISISAEELFARNDISQSDKIYIMCKIAERQRSEYIVGLFSSLASSIKSFFKRSEMKTNEVKEELLNFKTLKV